MEGNNSSQNYPNNEQINSDNNTSIEWENLELLTTNIVGENPHLNLFSQWSHAACFKWSASHSDRCPPHKCSVGSPILRLKGTLLVTRICYWGKRWPKCNLNCLANSVSQLSLLRHKHRKSISQSSSRHFHENEAQSGGIIVPIEISNSFAILSWGRQPMERRVDTPMSASS